MLNWRLVQPQIAKHTRVCSYDRAGFGFSDPGPASRDAAAIVSENCTPVRSGRLF